MLEILKSLCAIPTAPFRETAVREYIREFGQSHGLTVDQDAMGNMLLSNAAGRSGQGLVFAAHMDHPGFLIETSVGESGGTTTARFYGGVGGRYFPEAAVRGGSAGRFASRGIVEEAGKRGRDGFRRVTLRLDGLADRGHMAVWDLPNYRLRGDTFYARACDDLGGCAVILTMLAEMGEHAAGAGLFTVAEEAGFHGAFQVCREGFIPTGSRVVSVETSSELAGPRRGDGVVVRVGDRQSVFDPAMTAMLLEAGRGAKCKIQRALMDGGTCEGTAYQWHGYRTGALALPLGNYHNQNVPRGRVGMESIALSDVQGAVALMLKAVRYNARFSDFQQTPVPEYRDHHGSLGEWKLKKH